MPKTNEHLSMVSRLRAVAVVFVACVLYGCIADTMSQKLQTAELQVGLNAVVDVIESGDRAEVLYYLENTSAQPIRFLPWNTPLEGELTADIFDITFDGESLQYQGIMIKRSAPVDSDYDTLAVGERREVVVDLSESYGMAAAGSYSVRLRTFGDEAILQIDGVDAAIVSEPITIVRQ